jgi:hypothetical protein
MKKRNSGTEVKSKLRGFILKKENLPWLLMILFAVSILVRLPNLNRPLSVHHEWLTSTSLRHIQIFYECGPGRVFYSPSLTYCNAADKNINHGLAVKDPNGNLYYLSFPPFAFIFPYAVFKTIHIYPTIFGLQIFNLFFHFLSCVLIFLIISMITAQDYRGRINLPALAGFVCYLFSPAPLWFQSNVYMSDMFVQTFFIAGIYLFLKIISSEKKWPFLVLFAMVNFMTIYTEWLGVFLAFCIFVYAVFHFRKRGMAALACVTALTTLLPLALTIWQYSLISGLPALIEYEKQKFLFRTGDARYASGGFSFININSWLNIIVNYIGGFLPFIIFIVYTRLLNNKRVSPENRKYTGLENTALMIAFIPAALHHLIFFNFTAIHDFAALKGGVFISILAAFLYHTFMKYRTSKMDGKTAPTKTAIIHYLLAGMVVLSIVEYLLINSYGAHDRYKKVGEAIRAAVQNDEVVFVGGDMDPQHVLYAHRNLEYWQGREKADALIRKNGVTKGVHITLNKEQDGIVSVERFSIGRK